MFIYKHTEAQYLEVLYQFLKMNVYSYEYTNVYENFLKRYNTLIHFGFGSMSFNLYLGTGASTNKCSDTYCGTGPMSEPENKALQDAVESTEDVRAFFSMHSYSQLLLVPYAYGNVLAPDYSELVSIHSWMKEKNFLNEMIILKLTNSQLTTALLFPEVKLTDLKDSHF